MKKRSAVLCIFIAGCTPVVQKSTPVFDRLFVADVESRKEVILKPNESKAARIAIGLLSVGIVGAIGAAQTEEGFDEPKAYEYSLIFDDGEKKNILSRSFVKEGSCVEVISPDESELEVLRKLSSVECGSSNNEAMHSTSE